MGKMSRDKGARGERELASVLRAHGFDTHRGQQTVGAAKDKVHGTADLVGLPGIHIESKRVETLSLYKAMAQAEADAQADEIPVVMHRRNHCEWLVIMKLDDWVKFYRESGLIEGQTL